MKLPSDQLKRIDPVDSDRLKADSAKREANDAAIINSNADRLNQEAVDVLEYQRLP